MEIGVDPLMPTYARGLVIETTQAGETLARSMLTKAGEAALSRLEIKIDFGQRYWMGCDGGPLRLTTAIAMRLLVSCHRYLARARIATTRR